MPARPLNRFKPNTFASSVAFFRVSFGVIIWGLLSLDFPRQSRPTKAIAERPHGTFEAVDPKVAERLLVLFFDVSLVIERRFDDPEEWVLVDVVLTLEQVDQWRLLGGCDRSVAKPMAESGQMCTSPG